MDPITAFVAGCLFTLLLTGACLLLVRQFIDIKEEGEARVEEKWREIRKKASSGSSGGVVRPKTADQKRLERDDEYQAQKELLERL